MRDSDRSKEVAVSNERSLITLSRAITLSEGNFALILVRCNYEVCKDQMWQRLQELTGRQLSKIVLQQSIKSLFTTIFSAQRSQQTAALIVLGLESVTAIEQVLISTNQIRDEFRKNLNVPLVLWVTEEVLQKLTRFAPDFKSWAATSIKFELTTNQLLALWNQTVDELFATILSSDWGKFIPNDVFNLAPGCRRRQEIETAMRDLQARQVNLEPAQCATWQFILGRDAFSYDQIDVAIELYEQSLGFWRQELRHWRDGDLGKRRQIIRQSDDASTSRLLSHGDTQGNTEPYSTLEQPPTSSPVHLLSSSCLERQGVVLYHIGLAYCRQAELKRAHSQSNWEQAKESFKASIEVLTAACRSDLVAQLTIQLGEVLQRLERWTDLQTLALQSLEQPEIRNTPVRLAQSYGFLASVAYSQSSWEDAKTLALTALNILDCSQSHQPQHRALYLLVSAKSQRQLGEPLGAIAHLEQAIVDSHVETSLPNSLQQQPQLYMDILEELRSLYHERKQYLRAFELKQEKRSIEQQYGFCTFIGATPLQPRRQLQENRNSTRREIAAAGRQPDVNQLIERLSRNDHKLTVLHGSSGVGKSSLISAGLVPTLEARIISARVAIPVVQKVYGDWIGELERCLTEALANWSVGRLQVEERLQISRLKVERSNLQISPHDKLQTILEQLQLSYERNLLTVLIFDQFEEFFFVCTNPVQRRQFYDFLAQCLNLPCVKVILSLREDYLHYLLECERYSNLNTINNNILDRQLRYHLGDISAKDAKNIICTLATQSQFQLEEPLIEALVQDLVSNSGAVRLIELQVVGAQLQAEKITTLEKYQALGAYPIASLVERSLLNVIADCGSENENFVWQVLFSLTDDRGTRPLKTKSELVKDELNVGSLKVESSHLQPSRLQFSPQEDQLDLILSILIGSGLVFRVPEELHERYQLVHDYLVEPIRQKYEQRAQLNYLTKLEETAGEILRVRKQRVRAIALGFSMALLTVAAGGLGWRAEVQRRRAAELSMNAQLSAMSASSEVLFASQKDFDALLEGLRAARRLIKAETVDTPSLRVEPDTRLQVVTALEQAVYGVHERNRLEGHGDVVSNVSFSPDGQLIASASTDKTVKLWRPNGTLVNTLIGHQASITSVAFSPDSQILASGSWDGTVKLWRRDGTPRGTLKGEMGHVHAVSFSPNGQQIAAAADNGKIWLWTVGGKLVRTFRAHQSHITGVSFSPTGDLIASASQDQTIRLWTPQGKLLQILSGHSGKVNSVAFSPDGQTIASASDDRTLKLWNRRGELLQTFPIQPKWLLGVAFSADGQTIASAGADNTVKLWHRNGTLLKTFTGHSDKVTAVSFSPLKPSERSSGYPVHQLIASASYDKTVKLWGLPDQDRLTLQHPDDVRDVTFSPDNQLIATVGNDATVRIWNRAGQILKTLKGHTDHVCSVTFSPDGQLLVTGSRDGTVRFWNRQGALIKVLRGHKDWVLKVSFSPDGERLASASRDGTMKLWNRQGSLIKTLKAHQSGVNAVSFSADGKLLASAGDDKMVKLWTADGVLLKTLEGHSHWVLDVSFSPDGQMLASASYDDTVKLWSREGKLIRTLRGHTDSVAHVRFSPRGNILATTSWDNRIQLWRLDDTLIQSLENHKDRVTNVNWSNDGKALVSASQDNTVIVWNLDLDDLLHKSCDWLRDYLDNNPKVRQSDRLLCEPIKSPNVPKSTEIFSRLPKSH